MQMPDEHDGGGILSRACLRPQLVLKKPPRKLSAGLMTPGKISEQVAAAAWSVCAENNFFTSSCHNGLLLAWHFLKQVAPPP